MKQSIPSWSIAVGILLTVVQLQGCSAEKPPSTEPVAPQAHGIDPAHPTTSAEAPEPAEPAAGPAPDQDQLPQEPSTEPDRSSASLQESLDQEPPPLDGDAMLAELGYVSPADKVRSLLADPPGATRISQQSSLWVDVKDKRVFADGYVAQREAYLEMFACPAETKEHESIVGVVAQSSEVHAALLAIGATQGTTVRYDPEYIPATGQRIRIWVMWYDEDGKFHSTDARRWVRNVGTEDSLKLDWVFAGSLVWQDPSDGKQYYQADGGEMICVSNFSTALLDLPVESSDANNDLLFDAFTERIPPQGTAVRLMFVPIAASGEEPEEKTSPVIDPDQPPAAELMPRKESESSTGAGS